MSLQIFWAIPCRSCLALLASHQGRKKMFLICSILQLKREKITDYWYALPSHKDYVQEGTETSKLIKEIMESAMLQLCAHYWLNRTRYNHAIVSRIGGWKSVQTLIDCYGQPDEDYIIIFLTSNQKANEFMDCQFKMTLLDSLK